VRHGGDGDDDDGRLMELLSTLVRLALGAPTITMALLWWWAASWARRRRIGWSVLGPIVVATWLWKERRNLRGAVAAVSVVAVAAAWVWAVLTVPSVRWAAAVAIPAGAWAGWLWWAATTHPGVDPITAVRYHLAIGRHATRLGEAARASTGDGARVESVTADGDTVEATIVGPPGKPHEDLVSDLRASLAESVLAQTGRQLRGVAVVGTGARGRVLVRCQTHDPYVNAITLADLERA